ncbi:hypothetical protein MRB53_002247 [Persea americana]|uniref:Uncharacterized protein n=1 Tax=Persea americana TaxID=3435 RepID=A0ACC2MU24_PERAE|nr:hypothetical protein MRB53_002247 [Persea americana]
MRPHHHHQQRKAPSSLPLLPPRAELISFTVKSCREGQKWACSLVYWSPLPDCWLFQDCAIGLLFALLPVLGGNSQLFQGIISMARLLLVLSLFLTVASILSWSFVPSFLKLMIQLSSQTNELYQLASVAFCLFLAWENNLLEEGRDLEALVIMCLVGMYKNQLQELAQRSCFNLPSYACIREGPDPAPRFKATVNFNGEIFEGPSYCFTLRQAEHAAAEVALHALSTRGPSRCLATRVLDETGVYKNLLQETAHRPGLNLPVYTTVRSGPGHLPVFTCTVELAGRSFTGEPAKTKKQAEKNAAMVACIVFAAPNFVSVSHINKESESNEEREQAVVARVLSNFRPKDGNKPFRQKDQQQLRRRVTLGYKENSSASSANTLHYQQSRCLDLLSDVSSVYPAQPHGQQNLFLASHPTGSRINLFWMTS